MKTLQFHNPVFKALLALFFASSINDFWSITIGLPTPTQLALLYGFYVFYVSNKVSTDSKFKPLRVSLFFYLLVIMISAIYVTVIEGEFSITAITICINILWIFSAIPYLSVGFEEEDLMKFFKIIFYIPLLITLPSGLYELITHTNLLKAETGLSNNVFYLRGLHLDKLEFSSMLALMIFISISFLLKSNPVVPRFILIASIFISFILLGLSYSTTALLGTISGVVLMTFLDKRKVLLYLPLIIITLWVTWEIVSSLEIFRDQIQAYELKYELNVTQSEERNFRTMAWKAAYEKIIESPIVGYGIGNSADVVLDYFSKEMSFVTNNYINLEKAINTHNFLFNELLDFGILGAFPLFLSVGLIYYYLYKSNYYSKIVGLDFLLRICVGLSCFMVFRFVFYYHRFDQSLYVLWLSLVLGLYATLVNRLKYESLDSGA